MRAKVDGGRNRRSSGPLHLAYLVNQYPSISVTFVRREIKALERDGVRVTRYSIRDTGGRYPDETDTQEYAMTQAILGPGRIRRVTVATIRTATRRPIRFMRALRLAFTVSGESRRPLALHLVYVAEACVLRTWAAAADVDHVHVHFGTNAAIVAMLGRVLGGPTFSVTVHGSDEFERPREVALGLQVERAAFTVAVSDQCRAQVLRWADPAAWSKVHVVRCGLDDAYLRTAPAPFPAARSMVCVARLGPEKGHRILLEALAALAREGVEFDLGCVGDGTERPALEEMIETTGLRERVRLVGWVDGTAVRSAIIRSRVFVLPSFAESLPVVLMEALALGRPVIATRVGGVSELVTPGVNGWLVDAGNVRQLADAVRDALACSDAELARMGEAGRAAVLARHDVSREAAKLLALYRRYVPGPRRQDGPPFRGRRGKLDERPT